MSNTSTTATHEDKTWMGITEVSGLFEVSRNTATALLQENKIKCLKLRNKYRYDRAQVMDLYQRSILNGDD